MSDQAMRDGIPAGQSLAPGKRASTFGGTCLPLASGWPKPHFARHGFEQLTGYDIDFVSVLEGAYSKSGMDCDSQVRRQRPGRLCPDEHEHVATCERGIDRCRVAGQGKLDVDRGARVLLVLDFRFGERRLVVNAPVDGARAL